jgi:hypothetical protein
VTLSVSSVISVSSLWQERLAACGLPFLQAALHFLAEKLNNSAILTSEDGPPQACVVRLVPLEKQLLAVQLVSSRNGRDSYACCSLVTRPCSHAAPPWLRCSR